MEPFLEFARDFWWLIFPIMGVLGGLGSAWERASRRRHRRRLEILKAKGELRAAKNSASASANPVSPASAATTAEVSGTTALQRLLDTHDEVTHRWLEYELDAAKIIAFPAMSDGRQPLTAAFLRAKKFADGLRPASAKARFTREELSEYRNAVTDYELAFEVAERDARRIKDSSFSDAERKRLDVAKQLLSVAVDQAATPAERQLAYRRVREELNGLISLSDEAIEILEEKVALELTPGEETSPPRSEETSPAAAEPAPTPQAAPLPRPEPPTSAPGRVIRPR